MGPRARPDQLSSTEQRLAELAGNPDLTWYPRKPGSHSKVRGGLPDLSRPVTLRYGERSEFSTDGRPSYANEHRRRLAEQTNLKHALEEEIATYACVLAGWAPEKYPVTGAVQKIETTHMATPRKNSRGDSWTGILCRFTRQGYASDSLRKTNEPGEVNCKRCRAALGLPA